MRTFAPGVVDVAGPAQYACFALTLGLVGAFMGAAIGAGTSWAAQHRHSHSQSTPPTTGAPHAV